MRSKLLVFFLLSVLCGCIKPDTNPNNEIHEVTVVLEEKGLEVKQPNYREEEQIALHQVDKYLTGDLTVDKAVAIALLNSPRLKAAYEEVGVSKAKLAQAKILKNPVFDLAYRFSLKKDYKDTISMNLLQSFLDNILIPSRKKLAKAELESIKAKLAADIINTIAEVKIAYFSYITAKKNYQLAADLTLAKELAYEVSKNFYEQGNITELVKEKSLLRYELMKIDLANLETDVLEKKEKINELLGLYGKQVLWKAPMEISICIKSPQEDLQNVENTAIQQSLNLQMIRYQLLMTAKEYNIMVSEKVFSPWNLGVSSEREDDGAWSVGPAIVLALPFFDIGAATSAIGQAEIYRQWNLYTAQAIKIRTMARTARIQLLNAYRKAKYYESKVLRHQEEIFKLMHQQYNAMQVSVYDLLIAKEQEIEAKMAVIDLQKNWLIATIFLEQLLLGSTPMQEIGVMIK
ncbi:MAG: TolC family protein [Chlamydiota bacterium]|jgi:cobalt-zinc-cadmium efflux system outer membrane protein